MFEKNALEKSMQFIITACDNKQNHHMMSLRSKNTINKP